MRTLASAPPATMVNKVPQVTVAFWVIKIMCTTIGQTAADYLNENLRFGLTKATIASGTVLFVLLALQFAVRRYIPAIYWAVVVAVSVFGTLLADSMTHGNHAPLPLSTRVFAVLLVLAVAAWYGVEGTLSIDRIVTRRREAFYWLTVLFTFSLGTAAGDYVGDQFGISYGLSIAVWGGAIAVVAAIHWGAKLSSVLTFWCAYVLTRPLGASIGDFMSQHGKAFGGLGLGTTGTSSIFVACVIALVTFLTVTKGDQTPIVLQEVEV